MARNLLCKNDLIEMTKDYNSTQLKVFYNMLYFYKEKVMYTDTENLEEECSLEVDRLSGFLGKKNLTQKEIIDIILDLPKGIYNKDGSTFVAVFEYIYFDFSENIVMYNITESFKPLIEDVIKNFTVLELSEMANLNSRYSLRMYEFVSKNKNLGTYLIPINEFRQYFQVPESYQMCTITDRILNYCTKEINGNTTYRIKIDKVKKGRKITHLKIYMVDTDLSKID